MDLNVVVSNNWKNIGRVFLINILLVAVSLTLASCRSTPLDIKREVQIPKEAREIKSDKALPPKPETPEFIPVSEDASPLKVKIIDIIAKNISLGNVLHVIAEATNLNLAIEKDVDVDKTLSLSLKNVTAEDALNTVFSSVDYYYTVKNNLLLVKGVDTRIFELGHPAVSSSFSMDLGGDIVGGALANTAGGAAGGSIKGNITQNVTSDKTAFDFWKTLEESMQNVAGISCGTGAGKTQPVPQAQAARPPQPEQSLQPQSGAQSTQFIGQSSSTPVQPAQESCSINKMTGTVMITASKRNMEKIERYIENVKKVINRQVLVEAKIIEVQLSNTLEFGIDWSAVHHMTTSPDAVSFGVTNFASVVPAAGPVFAAGWSRGTSFRTLLKALQTQGEVRTLSNPRLNLMNGQTALLSAGTSQSYLAKITTTTATGTATVQSQTTEDRSVLSGVMIGIVPYISESGEITMTVTPIISNLVNFTNVALAGGNSVSFPKTDIREMSTTVKVKDGEMIVIGGLITKSESVTDNQVPFLGNVPIFGNLFKSKDKQERKTELVIILQPVIVTR